MPPARPQAATAPRYLVVAQALASVWLPTVSTTPAQRSLPIGLPGADSSLRSMTSAAPNAFKCSASAGRPVDATTV